MNSFDLVFWALLFLILLKIINTSNSKLWLLFGLIAGLGLLNKISIAYFLLPLAGAMLFTPERKFYRDKFLWLGGVTALVIFMPYIIWNVINNFPTIEFIQNASRYKISEITPLKFFTGQILELGPFNLPIWLSGLILLLFSQSMSKYKLIGFIYLFAFTLLALQNSKPYYLAASYPPLFAAGAIGISGLIASRKWNFLKPAVIIYTIIGGIIIMPFAIPILPVESFIKYSSSLGIKNESAERSELGALPQHFADRFGWEEMTIEFARIYNSLSEEEKKYTVIAVGNYGEAGALNYYGRKYRLPRVFCPHNSHWLWGNEQNFDDIKTVLILGGEPEDHLDAFKEVTLAGKVDIKFSMPYENNQPIYIARHPYVDLRKGWMDEKIFI